MNKKDLADLNPPSDDKVCDLFMGHVELACLTSAIEVKIFDAINETPLAADEIATSCQLHPGSTQAVCNVLSASEVLNKEGDRYSLTESSRAYLVSKSPLYRGYQFRQKNFWHEKILNTLGDGWSPIGADGKSFTAMWEEGTLSTEAAERFTGMMHTNISGPAIATAKSGFFENHKHIADIGGGSGIFLSALKQIYPGVKASLVELPQVCDAAKEIIKHYISPEQIHYFACNMFKDPWPSDADAFFMSNILHDWPKEKALFLLKQAHQYLQENGTLYIFECLLNEDRISPKHTVIFDLLMYANHQSQQYTLSELKSMTTEAGFSKIEKVFEFGYYSLLKVQ